MEQSDDFAKINSFEHRPVGLLVEEMRRPRGANTIATAQKLTMSDIDPDSKTPDLPVFGYERPDAAAFVVSRVRKKLTSLIALHLK